jgi:hypothetical protein
VGEVSQELQERRAYLGSYADRYFELLPSGGHQQLPIASAVVFTENGQRLRLGQGLWATATGAARTRAVTVLDGPAGQIATWGMVTEAGHDAILGVRLKVDDEGLIDEIDTFVVRFNDMASTFSGTGLLDAQRLAGPTPGLLDLVDEGDRPSAAELRRAADGYLDGVSSGEAGLIPVADDCPRIENGVQTVLRTDGLLPGRAPNPRPRWASRSRSARASPGTSPRRGTAACTSPTRRAGWSWSGSSSTTRARCAAGRAGRHSPGRTACRPGRSSRFATG